MTMFCQKAKIKISLFLIDGQHFHENTKTVKNMLKKVFILFFWVLEKYKSDQSHAIITFCIQINANFHRIEWSNCYDWNPYRVSQQVWNNVL